MKTFAFVFPGQGSQSVGMLDAWGDHPAVLEVLNQASAALGEDVGALIKTGPAEKLALTENTQVVMLTAGVACYRAWLAEGGAAPAAVAGHSLGEYSALVAAGVLTLADAVPLVRMRAQAMQAAVPAGAGAMVPAITICLGSLKLAADTASPTSACADAQHWRTASASRPSTATIAPAPAGTAACIACARMRTSGTASARVSTPAATSALYSPSECPATAAGAAPPSASHAR
jgi:[acyl-carrier-protein] S-malonyltransferase